MSSILDPADATAIRARLHQLRPDAERQWGTMTAHQMLCHLIDGFRVPLGESPSTIRKSWLRLPPVRWLLIHLIPWPEGKVPTAREFRATQPTTWEADLATWDAACDRWVASAADPAFKPGPHPMFGHLKASEWSVLIYRHVDHHLRQFGG